MEGNMRGAWWKARSCKAKQHASHTTHKHLSSASTPLLHADHPILARITFRLRVRIRVRVRVRVRRVGVRVRVRVRVSLGSVSGSPRHNIVNPTPTHLILVLQGAAAADTHYLEEDTLKTTAEDAAYCPGSE